MKPEVEAKFATYPVEAQEQLKRIRNLIFSVAEEDDIAVPSPKTSPVTWRVK